jgi:hypothetical protein
LAKSFKKAPFRAETRARRARTIKLPVFSFWAKIGYNTRMRRSRPYSFKRQKRVSVVKLLVFLAVLGGLLLGLAYFLAPPPAERLSAAAPESAGVELPPPAALPASPPPVSLTGEASAPTLLENTLSLWVNALLTGDYRAFHASLAPAWKAKDDPAKLLSTYKVMANRAEDLKPFPGRGKLVLLESGPYAQASPAGARASVLRDTVGPESPWLIRGEWRNGGTTLNFTLILTLDQGAWKPVGLRVELYGT